jgi:predicted transcriptional regulator YdeE
MVSFSVPTANYAVYTHHGKADGLQESWANAYREAAAAGYTLAPFAFEYYPPGFTDSANDVIELYLAVQ